VLISICKFETQKNNRFDTYSCVSFAHTNGLETLHKFLYKEEINYSDRYTSKASGTVPGKGNSHAAVAECTYTNGVVPEEVYPFTPDMSQSEFFSLIPKEVIALGKEWVVKYEYGYEKVRKEHFAEVLKLSPIQVAVDSRTNKTSQWRGADHSVMMYKLDDKAHIFDSYFNRFVEYDLSYPFSYGMRYHYKKIIELKVTDPITKTEYRFELVKSNISPEIWLKDSDDVLHHISSPDAFIQCFGQKAWDLKFFSIVPFSEIDVAKKGKPISVKNETAGEALSDLLKIVIGKK